MTDEPKQHTGGMLALIPDNPAELAVPGGDPAEQIHLTLLYLGDDVTSWPAGQAAHLKELITASGPGLDPVTARVIGPALFNPDGGPNGDRDPCLVLLIGDTPDLEPLRKWALWVMATGEDYPDLPDQHKPFIPHMTVASDILGHGHNSSGTPEDRRPRESEGGAAVERLPALDVDTKSLQGGGVDPQRWQGPNGGGYASRGGSEARASDPGVRGGAPHVPVLSVRGGVASSGENDGRSLGASRRGEVADTLHDSRDSVRATERQGPRQVRSVPPGGGEPVSRAESGLDQYEGSGQVKDARGSRQGGGETAGLPGASALAEALVGINTYTGPVRFTTLRLALGGDVLDVPLGDQETDMPGAQIKSITFTPPKAVREAAAGLEGDYAQAVIEGKALDMAGLIWVAGACGPVGLSWAGDMMGRAEVKSAVGGMNMGRVVNDGPACESIDDLHRAIEDHGNCPAEDRPGRVRVLRGHAKRLGASAHTLSRIDTLEGASTDGSGTKSVPEVQVETKSWAPGNSAPAPIPHLAALQQAINAHSKVRDSHKVKHKAHLAAEAQRLGAPPHVHAKIGYLEPHSFFNHPETKSLEDDVEVKVTSPAPGATRLRNFWARTAKGRAKWKPGIPGDFKRLRRHLAKYVHNPRILNGLTANIHKIATGVWPGKNAHTLKEKPGKPITYGIKSLVDWDWDATEVKALATDEAGIAALFADIEEWGQIFDEPWVAAYLAELDEAQGDTPDEGEPTEVERTAVLAARGAKLVTDPDPVVVEETEPEVQAEPEAPSGNVRDDAPDTPDTPETPVDDGDGGWGALFAAAGVGGESAT